MGRSRRPRPVRRSLVAHAQERGRHGFALLVALIAVLLIAALITGAFSATTEETRIGAAAADRQAALSGAESAIESGISMLSSGLEAPIGVGETKRHEVGALGGATAFHMTRLDSSLYWVVGEAGGISSTSGISRRIGVLVRASNAPGHSITIDRISERGWSELF